VGEGAFQKVQVETSVLVGRVVLERLLRLWHPRRPLHVTGHAVLALNSVNNSRNRAGVDDARRIETPLEGLEMVLPDPSTGSRRDLDGIQLALRSCSDRASRALGRVQRATSDHRVTAQWAEPVIGSQSGLLGIR
jgi:hypothetical protein